MRHKYATTGIVLSRYSAGEANASLVILTPEFGLIRARVQGIRKPGAKLANALQTLSEGDLMLVRGKDGWRLSGALLVKNWARELDAPARLRAGRVSSIILRLVRGEVAEAAVFDAYAGFLRALPGLSGEEQDAAECLAALKIVQALGLDAGDMPDGYDAVALAGVAERRLDIVSRINRGLKASGL